LLDEQVGEQLANRQESIHLHEEQPSARRPALFSDVEEVLFDAARITGPNRNKRC
jgi:hypothetical protein